MVPLLAQLLLKQLLLVLQQLLLVLQQQLMLLQLLMLQQPLLVSLLRLLLLLPQQPKPQVPMRWPRHWCSQAPGQRCRRQQPGQLAEVHQALSTCSDAKPNQRRTKSWQWDHLLSTSTNHYAATRCCWDSTNSPVAPSHPSRVLLRHCSGHRLRLPRA